MRVEKYTRSDRDHTLDNKSNLPVAIKSGMASKPRWFSLLLVGLCFALSFYATANSAMADNCDRAVFNAGIAQLESSGGCASGSAGYTCVNTLGYLGKYQMSQAQVAQWGSTPSEYLNNPAQQEAFMNRLTNQNLTLINNSTIGSSSTGERYPGLSSFIGQTYNGVTITQEGLMAACHLKGCLGVARCLNHAGSCTDGYGTDVAKYFNAFAGSACTAGSGTPTAETNSSPMCDPTIRARVAEQVQAGVQMMADFKVTNSTMPRPLSEVANTPCMSNELQRISNQFAYAPSMYAANILGQLNGLAGPVSGLMNKMLDSLFTSFTNAANMNPLANQFTSFAQTQISSIFTSLGLGGAFSSALCGMMVDMVLKYVQCVAPIKLPSLGQLTGSLNDLLPKGCAGAALTSALYAVSNNSAVQSLAQPITIPSGGLFSTTAPTLGTASGRH